MDYEKQWPGETEKNAELVQKYVIHTISLSNQSSTSYNISVFL
jgi:hypothetical protein